MRIAMPTTTLVAALFMVISTMATAQTRTQIDLSALGPQVGQQVPDFDLPDQNGLRHTLETVRGPNGSLILFHRSADW
jgi:cytochrome oxidase Cu insertion factor (SCO1/SenC/PrrC family)